MGLDPPGLDEPQSLAPHPLAEVVGREELVEVVRALRSDPEAVLAVPHELLECLERLVMGEEAQDPALLERARAHRQRQVDVLHVLEDVDRHDHVELLLGLECLGEPLAVVDRKASLPGVLDRRVQGAQ